MWKTFASHSLASHHTPIIILDLGWQTNQSWRQFPPVLSPWSSKDMAAATAWTVTALSILILAAPPAGLSMRKPSSSPDDGGTLSSCPLHDLQSPSGPVSPTSAAKHLFAAGKHAQALACLQLAVKQKPTSKTLANLANGYMSLRDWPKAASALEQARSRDPSDQEVRGAVSELIPNHLCIQIHDS